MMQRFILSRKNQITLLSAILIATGLISIFAFSNEYLFNWAFITASILGASAYSYTSIPIFTSKGSKYRCPSNYCSYRSICHKEL